MRSGAAPAFNQMLIFEHNKTALLAFAGKGTVYDYFVNPKTGKFQPWAELVVDVQYDSSKPMNSVFVPTAETSSLRFFLDMMVELHKPIMFVGGGYCRTECYHSHCDAYNHDADPLHTTRFSNGTTPFSSLLQAPVLARRS